MGYYPQPGLLDYLFFLFINIIRQGIKGNYMNEKQYPPVLLSVARTNINLHEVFLTPLISFDLLSFRRFRGIFI